MGALGFTLAGSGLVLIWAGVKGEDLREVLTGLFSGARKFKKPAGPPAKPNPTEGSDKANMPQTDAALAKAEAAARKAAMSGATSATAPPGTVR